MSVCVISLWWGSETEVEYFPSVPKLIIEYVIAIVPQPYLTILPINKHIYCPDYQARRGRWGDNNIFNGNVISLIFCFVLSFFCSSINCKHLLIVFIHQSSFALKLKLNCVFTSVSGRKTPYIIFIMELDPLLSPFLLAILKTAKCV